MRERWVRAAIFVAAMLGAAWITFVALSLGVSVSAG
jgi:hypothetical protein